MLLKLGADHTVVAVSNQAGSVFAGKTVLELVEEAELDDGDAVAVQHKEESAAVLRQWAEAHPNAAYNAHLAANAAAKAERKAGIERALASMYEAMGAEDRGKVSLV